MMGERSKSEALFYYFKLEDQVSENHLLRLLDRYVDFGFVCQRLRRHYSHMGRPSIDPELLLLNRIRYGTCGRCRHVVFRMDW